MRRRGTRLFIVGVLIALPACGGCEAEDGMAKERQRLWGRDKATAEVEAKAAEKLDPQGLDVRPDLKNRVLGMGFREAVARLGFLEYQGKATFNLGRNKHELGVVEDTLIEHGLHGSYRVVQKDGDGSILRETVFTNGVYYVRNGPGKLRVQGVRQDEHTISAEQAFEPLATFTRYYGPRLGLSKVGTETVEGRSAVRYDLVLLQGSDLVEVAGMKGKKKPVKLKGSVYIDEATATPIKAKLSGQLAIPPPEGHETWGQLDLALDFVIRTSEGKEIKPGEFIPTITRHPVDLNPTAFLDGGTRTSTIIGGKAN